MDTSNTTYWADAEVSFDGGLTWVRGTESARKEFIRSTDGDRTGNFPFAGGFKAGTRLRFMQWAENANCSVVTTSNQGSIAPAIRLTYNLIPCVLP